MARGDPKPSGRKVLSCNAECNGVSRLPVSIGSRKQDCNRTTRIGRNPAKYWDQFFKVNFKRPHPVAIFQVPEACHSVIEKNDQAFSIVHELSINSPPLRQCLLSGLP